MLTRTGSLFRVGKYPVTVVYVCDWHPFRDGILSSWSIPRFSSGQTENLRKAPYFLYETRTCSGTSHKSSLDTWI